MISIISAEQFNIVPWKNGRGQTTELLINPGGHLDDFDWRISIADMVADGVFSSFDGFTRQLVLHSGEGLALTHRRNNQQVQQDILNKPLDIVTFDGGDHTDGCLTSGPVKNFNVMSKTAKYHSHVQTYRNHQSIQLPCCTHCFVYCVAGQVSLTGQNITVLAGQLLHLTPQTDANLIISGQQMVVISLSRR